MRSPCVYYSAKKKHPYYHAYTFHKETGIIRRKKCHLNGTPMGRKRDMSSVGCLGLVLMWYRTTGACTRTLSMNFGQTSTPMYRWLKFGRRILLRSLINDDSAKLELPTTEKIELFCEAINAKYPVLAGLVWAAMDGLKLNVQESGKVYEQNQYFNGWTHGHYVNSLYVFGPDGKICICVLNAPGTFHDSTMADYHVYDSLEDIFRRTGKKVVVDSAFGSGNRTFLVKSSQGDPINGNAEDLLMNRAATSIRQLSEWGMRMIQGQFPRITDTLIFKESGDRRVILRLLVHLYNFNCAQVGHNEILNSFMEKKDGFFGHPDITPNANDILI